MQVTVALASSPEAGAGQARRERRAGGPAQQRCLVVRAAKNAKGSTITKGGSATTKKQNGEQPGFKFDGSMQRWVRDDRFAGKSMTTVQPLSGTEYTVWPVMHSYLTEKGLKQVDEEEALALVRKGRAVIVDVRLADDYQKEHIEGAISVPMFRLTAGNSGWDKVKRFVMGSLAMKATERDPDFLANFAKAVGGNKRKTIIVACAVGGTLDTVVRVATTGKSAQDPDRAFGRETRSLKAAYELMQAGYTNVIHLKGGLSSWRYNNYPTEGSSVRD